MVDQVPSEGRKRQMVRYPFRRLIATGRTSVCWNAQALPDVTRGAEQLQTETVRVEVYSTRHAELAKTRVAAFSSSFCCVEKGTGQQRR
jgi:hypothetical protein